MKFLMKSLSFMALIIFVIGCNESGETAKTSGDTLPEFKGNASAVLTENYWAMELVQLLAREARTNREIKKLRSENKLTG